MKRFSLYLSLITLLGIIPRVILLVRRGSFWFDEIFTLELAQMPFGEMAALASRDTNPPLWTIIMWPWVHLLPHNEWLVRIPALILGTLTILFIGFLGRELSNDRTGLVAALLVALSPPLIFFSTEARVYALFTTLTVVAFLSAAYVIKKQSRRPLALHGIIALLLAATHIYAVIPLCALYLGTLHRLPRAVKKQWHLVHGGVIILFAAWFVFAYYAKFSDLADNSWFTRVTPGAGWPLTLVSSLFILKGTLFSAFFWVITAFSCALIIGGVTRVFKKNEQNLVTPILILLLGLTVAAFIGPAKIKYFIFVIPAIALLIAWMLSDTQTRWHAPALILLILAAIGSTTIFIREFRFSWDHVALVAAEAPQTHIIIPWAVNYLPFSYYYHGENPVLTVLSPGMKAVTIPELLATNWKWELPQEHIEKELARVVPQDGNILVIQSDPYVFGVQEWLEAHDWQRAEPQTFEAKNSLNALHSVRVERYKK